MTNRNLYFDFLRGVAIIIVIGIHCYTIDNNILFRQVLNAAVPLFIAVSGFFLSQKVIKDRDQYVVFWRKQIPKVYVPTLFWSLPLLILAVYRGVGIGKSIVNFFSCGFSIYYFIVFIIQCYLILPFVLRLESKYNKIMWGSSLMSIIWVGLMVRLTVIEGISLPIVVYAGPLPCWFMFFMLGIILGKYSVRNYSLWWPILITICGLVLSSVSAKYLLYVYHSGVGIKPTAFVYAFGLILFLFNVKIENFIKKENFIYKQIVWIGSISFPIYLVHMYILGFVVSKMSISSWSLRIIITVILTSMLIVVLKKIIPNNLHHYIGI